MVKVGIVIQKCFKSKIMCSKAKKSNIKTVSTKSTKKIVKGDTFSQNGIKYVVIKGQVNTVTRVTKE